MKKNRLYILIPIILVLLLLLFIYFLMNNKFIENNTQNNNRENTEQLNYNLFQCTNIPYNDVEKINNMYYKKIDTIEEYNSYKIRMAFMPECNTDFSKNFILLIAVENVSMEYLVPQKIYAENDKLYVGLVKDADTNPNYSAIILEIDKNLERDNIEVYKAINEDIPHGNYTPIKELPKNYTAEDAKNDNCYVVENDGTVSNSRLSEQFIDNYNNSKDAFIRMVKCSEDKETIIDVYYSSNENKFLVCIDNSREFENFTYNYYKFSSLDKKTLALGKDGSSDYYTLTDPYETDMNLFYI